MSNVFYSLVIGMLLLINPVHANNDSSTEENVPHLLEREVYTPIFVEFRTSPGRTCDDESHKPENHPIEFDGLLFHINEEENQTSVPVNPILNLNNESLIQKFWEMALVDNTLFPNVQTKE